MKYFNNKNDLIYFLAKYTDLETIHRKINSLLVYGGPISIFDQNGNIKGTIHQTTKGFCFMYRDSIMMY